ncbi:hypothetical protein BU23DRAFT_227294 [Bimuria novae-zelandiae CBS 107.79]|uniref:Uncharacterized protein n=1 Tax=Bimuria novae-zelandiae CBS 107.79 TaxID=1447943 RepID=A0A6A5VMQ8_9PLEO|nr:hypothetical protein BU23DRAFT_227294 [Bimuria novae-zelandiae CBS 107.79]
MLLVIGGCPCIGPWMNQRIGVAFPRSYDCIGHARLHLKCPCAPAKLSFLASVSLFFAIFFRFDRLLQVCLYCAFTAQYRLFASARSSRVMN